MNTTVKHKQQQNTLNTLRHKRAIREEWKHECTTANQQQENLESKTKYKAEETKDYQNKAGSKNCSSVENAKTCMNLTKVQIEGDWGVTYNKL